MNNIIILMGGKGVRLSSKGVPKPFLQVGSEYLYQIALNSALSHLPDSTTYSILSKRNGQFAKKNGIEVETDVVKVLREETHGPAETARKIEIDNQNPIYIVDCDVYFRIPVNILERDFDCKLFYFHSSNPSHSYIVELNGKVSRIVEKQILGDKGIVGIYGFKSKSQYDLLYDKTNFEGEEYLSKVIETAITLDYNVICDPCIEHYPLGTIEEFDMNYKRLLHP
jgi:bifunctional N-acetylglucosamine-1-phosphate-uridyltransferase/glucosamine-1-phosphate-acetyltransferase GlmU-like protein